MHTRQYEHVHAHTCTHPSIHFVAPVSLSIHVYRTRLWALRGVTVVACLHMCMHVHACACALAQQCHRSQVCRHATSIDHHVLRRRRKAQNRAWHGWNSKRPRIDRFRLNVTATSEVGARGGCRRSWGRRGPCGLRRPQGRGSRWGHQKRVLISRGPFVHLLVVLDGEVSHSTKMAWSAPSALEIAMPKTAPFDSPVPHRRR